MWVQRREVARQGLPRDDDMTRFSFLADADESSYWFPRTNRQHKND